MHLVPENEGATIGGRDDIDGAVVIQVYGGEVRTNAGAIVNQLGHKLRSTLGLRVPDGSVPI
jgi:hypothetical protein